jgi:hypothetical protein
MIRINNPLVGSGPLTGPNLPQPVAMTDRNAHMADVIREERFWCRRGTAADWASVNPTLGPAEIGVEIDTGRMKVGDATTPWNSLDYFVPGASEVTYNNVSSGLAATNVQTAIDEIAAGGGGGGGSNIFAEASGSWDFSREGVVTSSATGTSFVTNSAVPHAYIAGAGATATLTSVAGVPGICTLSTGTATNGYARLFFCPPVIMLGGGEIAYRSRFRIPTLSDVTNRFGVGIVMANVISGAGLQRIGAIYVDDTNSGQWVAQAIDGVGTATTNTTIAPTANTWIVTEIRPNAAGTSFELFIGPDSGAMATAGTVASNLPTVALGLSVQITKALGTTARTVEVDLADFRQTFTASR